ncbi:MAG: 4Fe-4S binding protein [Deltaproteobacteria bacterium]|nr:4Fe-4S binding protein [Deltaproteobacteria bacterium]
MQHFQVNDRCNGCLACVQNCPANALDSVDRGKKRTILHNLARCIYHLLENVALPFLRINQTSTVSHLKKYKNI